MTTGKSFLRILTLVFGVIGLVFFLIGASFLAGHLAFLQRAVETDALITDIRPYHGDDGTSYHVYVTYSVGDDLYEARLNAHSSTMRVGQTLPVRYDPERPGQVRNALWWLFPAIFGGIGLIFLAVVLALWLAERKQRSQADRLLTYGAEVTARISEVQRNASLQVNGRNPYLLICSWKDPEDGKTYLFRSGNLWFNPEPILQERRLTTLPVYIDPYDKKKYHVALDAVQQDVVPL